MTELAKPEPAEAPDLTLVSVSANGADLRMVLVAIAEQIGLNLVLDDGVQGEATLSVENVTAREALDALILSGGFDYAIRDGVLRVYDHDIQTRMFTLDYITDVQIGATRLSASSGSGTSSSDGTSSDDGGGTSRVTIDSESSTDFWRDIVSGLEAIVFDGSVGRAEVATQGTNAMGGDAPVATAERLVVHPLSGTLVVTASFAKLNRVAEFLERVEGSVHRQVMIEARIVEVALRDEFRAGIDWSQIPTNGGVESVFGQDEFAAQQSLDPENRVFNLAFSEGDFNFLLDALAVQGDIRVISSPRVVALNNQKAIIKVAREESFFSQRIDYEEQPSGALVPILTVEPQRVTIGLVLDVVPQISGDGDIMMNVHPSITELVGEDVFPPGADGADILANAPVLDIREVSTVVRVGHAQLLIIGGLMKDRLVEDIKSVPFLGSIPVLGHLFRRTDRVTERIELVVILKPQIVVGQEADAYARRETRRLRGYF